jgi:tRNA A37 threonylcarbamoyladenosine synthetase subunit TsaC/SUA5/YrdC
VVNEIEASGPVMSNQRVKVSAFRTPQHELCIMLASALDPIIVARDLMELEL